MRSRDTIESQDKLRIAIYLSAAAAAVDALCCQASNHHLLVVLRVENIGTSARDRDEDIFPLLSPSPSQIATHEEKIIGSCTRKRTVHELLGCCWLTQENVGREKTV
jgi:hypothetical protein